MNLEDLENLSLSPLKGNFYISKEFLFLTKGLTITELDRKMLTKWDITNTSLNYEEDDQKEDEEVSTSLEEEKTSPRQTVEAGVFFISVLRNVLGFVKENKEKVLKNIKKYQNPDLKKLNELLERAITIDRDKFIFYTNMFSVSNKLDEIIVKSIIYVKMLALELNVGKSTSDTLIICSLMSEIFYFDKTLETISRKISVVDLNFKPLINHIKGGYEKVKNVDGISRVTANIIVLHHEHLDGSGIIGVEKEKVPPLVHILTVIQEYLYLTTDFLSSSFEKISLHKTTLVMLKNRKKYHQEPLNTFLSLNSLYPSGEIVVLKKGTSFFHAIVISKSKKYKHPIVEIISLDKDGESTVIDLSKNMQQYEISYVLEDKKTKEKYLNNYRRKLGMSFE